MYSNVVLLKIIFDSTYIVVKIEYIITKYLNVSRNCKLLISIGAH